MSYFAHSDKLPGWASRVPGHWASNWLKWSVNLSTQRATEEEKETLPYISNEDIESWTGRLLIDEPKPAEADSRRFQEDDILFNKLRPYLAKVYHATFDGVSSGELLCLRSSQKVEPRFLFYVLVSKGLIDTINAETFGAKMPRADWEILGHQPLPLPSLDTQQRIVQFLNEKTAQIAGLIETKRALLDRLTEKRQAIITRGVTKGLNPGARTKPSGIEWLGDIPEHWEVLPVKRIAKLESGHTPDRKIDAYWYDCRIPWVSLNDTGVLREGDYISDTTFKINELGLANSSARMLPERAVVFTRDATIGESAITTRPMAVSQHIIAWLCDEERIIPEFLLLAIYGMRGELLRLTNGSTIGTIGLADVKSISVGIPPLDEQHSIVADVFHQKGQVAEVSEVVGNSIGSLYEYRGALITAAVTGQITELR
jgi:type I restriction enzyme S subunit